MRILHLTRDFPPRSNGGLSTAVGAMVRATQRAGHACAVLSFDAWRPQRGAATAPDIEPERAQDVEVVRLSSPAQLAAAHAWAAGFRADWTHVHHAMLWQASHGLSPRRMFTVHVAQAHMAALRGVPAESASARAQLLALREADRVTVPSEGVVAALPLRVGPRLRVVPLAVSDHLAARSASRRSRSLPRALYAGRYGDIKGTMALIEAWRKLRLPAAELVIAGGLPDSPKVERRWRRRIRAALGGAGQVHLSGWLGPAELSEAFASARLLVVPSKYETFGLSALEAMLHGAPIVATRTPGLAGLVRSGQTGLLVAPDDPEMMALALARLLDDALLAERMGEAAAKHVRSHWLWRQRIFALLAAYR